MSGEPQFPFSAIDRQSWDSILELWIDDGPGELLDLIDVYIADSAAHIASVRAAIAAGDPALLERAAHTLKSSSANMGALRASGICRDFQDFGRAKEMGRAAALLGDFLRTMDETRKDLEAERARLASGTSR